jgi:CreA protein
MINSTRIRSTLSAGLVAASCLAAPMLASPASAEQVGEVGVDWLGNDILIDAVSDPQVAGVTCHVAYFDRGVIDRLQKGQLVRGSLQCVDRLSPDRGDHHRRHRPR